MKKLQYNRKFIKNMRRFQKVEIEFSKIKGIKYSGKIFDHGALVVKIDGQIKILDLSKEIKEGNIKQIEIESYEDILFAIQTHQSKIPIKVINIGKEIIDKKLSNIIVGEDSKGEYSCMEPVFNFHRFKNLYEEGKGIFKYEEMLEYDKVFFMLLFQKGIIMKSPGFGQLYIVDKKYISDEIWSKENNKLNSLEINSYIREVNEKDIKEINNIIDAHNELMVEKLKIEKINDNDED